MEEVTGHWIEGNDVEFAFEAAFFALANQHRLSNEITAIFQPFGCLLLEMVAHAQRYNHVGSSTELSDSANSTWQSIVSQHMV